MITEAHRTRIADHYQATDVQVGYEDMANPLRVGTVVEHRAGEFRVMWDDEDGGETWSDLRQAGWSAVRPDYTIATTAGVVIAQVEHHDINDSRSTETAFRTVLVYNQYRGMGEDIEQGITDLIADLKLLGERDYGMEF